MEKILPKISLFADTINEWVGTKSSWLTTLLVILVCYDVTVRYFFHDTAAWIMELEWHLFSLIFLLGAGYAYKHDKHVRVDLFYSKYSKKQKAETNLLGDVLFLVPWCLFVIIYAYKYAETSWLIGEGSPDPGGLPARYVIKFAVVIGVSLLLLQGIGNIAKSWNTILEEKRQEDLLDEEEN